MIDLGNTKDQIHRRHGDHRAVVRVSDRDRGGQFATYEVQEMAGTLRQVELQREIGPVGGRVPIGTISSLHYAELLRLRRLENMSDQAFMTLKRAYLNHPSYSKFQITPGFQAWSPYGWFIDMLDNPKELTKFYSTRLALRLVA